MPYDVSHRPIANQALKYIFVQAASSNQSLFENFFIVVIFHSLLFVLMHLLLQILIFCCSDYLEVFCLLWKQLTLRSVLDFWTRGLPPFYLISKQKSLMRISAFPKILQNDIIFKNKCSFPWWLNFIMGIFFAGISLVKLGYSWLKGGECFGI